MNFTLDNIQPVLPYKEKEIHSYAHKHMETITDISATREIRTNKTASAFELLVSPTLTEVFVLH